MVKRSELKRASNFVLPYGPMTVPYMGVGSYRGLSARARSRRSGASAPLRVTMIQYLQKTFLVEWPRLPIIVKGVTLADMRES